MTHMILKTNRYAKENTDQMMYGYVKFWPFTLICNGKTKGKTMLELKGKYNSAKVFTEVIDENAIAQITELCSQPMSEGSVIRIMPDVHAGAGCTIGTTMTITDKIVPNLVGVDIGCGMETVKLKEKHIEV